MLEFDVKMDVKSMYDYMMWHNYNSMSGLTGSIVGAVFIFMFINTRAPLYLIAGTVILLYLPVVLFLKAAQQVKANKVFEKPIHYRLGDDGILISQEDSEQLLAWDSVTKAVSTGNSIVVYTGRVNACIFPRKAMGEGTAEAIRIISTHIAPSKNKIRY